MFKKMALVILFVGLAICIAVLVTGVAGRHELVKQEKAWRAMGGVFDFSEMAPDAIPDEENAAVAYGVAFKFLDGLENEENYLLGADPAEEPDVNAVLDKCGEVIVQLRSASQMKKCRWDVDYDAGIDAMFSHQGSVRIAARLLASDAYRASESGRDEVVVRDIETMLRMVLHAANDSTITGQLVAGSVMGNAISLYENFFKDHAAPKNNIAAIADRYDDRALYKRGLMGDVALSRSMLLDMLGDTEDSIPLYQQFVLNWDQAYYLREVMRRVEDCDRPYYEAIKSEDGRVPIYAVAAGTSIPAFNRTARSLARVRLRAVMLVTAEKLRAYKAEHGAYPETDAKGGVKMPIDPVTGKPLVYERVGDGFVLTSEVKDGNGKNTEWRWD